MVEFDGIEFPDETPEIKVEYKEKTNEEYYKKLDADYNELCNGNGNDETKKETDPELELLQEKLSEDDIKSMIETMVKEAKHDRISIKQIFIGMCGGIGNIAIHHNVNSKNTGAGKSYLLILVSEYFPSKYILMLMGVSDKAFQHKEGTMVLKDPITNELTPTEPIITKLNLIT